MPNPRLFACTDTPDFFRVGAEKQFVKPSTKHIANSIFEGFDCTRLQHASSSGEQVAGQNRNASERVPSQGWLEMMVAQSPG
jgi:hypothetical protein